ncbi:MAG: hypothetical protein ACOCP5_03520, partial [Halanaerobiaceae bacterium]
IIILLAAFIIIRLGLPVIGAILGIVSGMLGSILGVIGGFFGIIAGLFGGLLGIIFSLGLPIIVIVAAIILVTKTNKNT